MENREWHRVVDKLAGNHKAPPTICKRCGATLITFPYRCLASYRAGEWCEGNQTIDNASRP